MNYTNYELELIEKVKLEMGIERDFSDKETKDFYDKIKDRMLEQNFSINEINEIRNRESENGTKFTLDEMIVIGDDFLFEKKILDFEEQNGKTFPPEILKKLREVEVKSGSAVTQQDLNDIWQQMAANSLKEELHPKVKSIIASAEKEYGRSMTFDEIHQLLNEKKDTIDTIINRYDEIHKIFEEITSEYISDTSVKEMLKICFDKNNFEKLTFEELVGLNRDFVKLIKNGGEDVEDLKRANKEVVQRIKGIKNGDLIEGKGLESLHNESLEALEKAVNKIREKKKKGVFSFLRKLFN